MPSLRSFLSIAATATSALLVTGCYADYVRSREPYLVQRAAFDMACDRTKLTVSWLSPGVRGVEGCGKRGTYVFVRESGSWLINGGFTAAAVATPAAPNPPLAPSAADTATPSPAP